MSRLLNGLAQLLGGLLGAATGLTNPGGGFASVTNVSDVLGHIYQAAQAASGMADHIAVSALQLIPVQSGSAYGNSASALGDAVLEVQGGFQLLLGQTYYGTISESVLNGSYGTHAYLSGINLSSSIGAWSSKLTSAGMYAGQNIASLALTLPADVVAATNPAAFMLQSNWGLG